MATTQNEHNGNGTLRRFDFTFPYIKEDDVKVSVRTSTADVTTIASTNYTFPSATEIQFNAVSETDFQESTGAPKTGVTVRIFRDTDLDTERVTFFPGSSIRAQDLNDNTLQNLYASQERQNRAVDKTGGSMTGDLAMNNANIVFEGENTTDGITTTLTAANPATSSKTITLPNTTGTVVTTGDSNTVTTTMVDGSLVDANIAANAEIAVSKLADGNARQLLQTAADGTTVEFTDNVDIPGTLDVTGNTTLDGSLSVATTSTLTGNITANGNIDLAGDIDVDGTANLDVVDVDGAVDLAENTTTAAGTDLRIQDGNAASFQVSEGTNAYLTFNTNDNQIETDQTLDIQNGWEISGTTVSSTAAELNLLNSRTVSGATISGDTNVRENELPTTQAVVAFVENQLDQIDGFVAVATRTDFPDTQPPQNVVVSVGDMDDLAVDQNGQATNATTDDGTAVTITGIEASFRPTSGTRDVDAGVRMLVISTGADQTYTYHKATLKESDLINLSNDINDFSNRYRVSGEEPDDSLDDGDLWWDTANNQLNAYDGDAWAPVTASGEFIRLLLRDTDGTAPTFDGNVRDYNLVREDDTSVAGSITTASQLLLSVDGVMQRPNAGTSIDTTGNGFCRVDADTIQLAGAPEAGAQVFAIQMGTATEINTPAEDSVDSQHYVDDSIDSQHLNSTTGSEAVTTDVIRDNAVGADALASDADNANNATRAVTTDHIRTGAVSLAKMANLAANSIIGNNTGDAATPLALSVADAQTLLNVADGANNYTHPNHGNGGGGDATSSADGDITIRDNVVNEAKLQVSNAPTNGFFLSAQSGNTGGLTWAEAGGGTILQMQVSPMNIGTIQSGSKSSYTDSNVTASFTPTAADSTVFVHLSASIHAHSNHETHIDFDFDIQRQIGSGSFTTVEEYDGNFAIRQATTSGSTTGQWQSNCSFVLEDSPETTDECTYMLRYRNTANGFLQWQTASTHVWTFMEIAA